MSHNVENQVVHKCAIPVVKGLRRYDRTGVSRVVIWRLKAGWAGGEILFHLTEGLINAVFGLNVLLVFSSLVKSKPEKLQITTDAPVEEVFSF